MNSQEKLAYSLKLSQGWAKAVPGNMEHYIQFIQTGMENSAPLDPATLQLMIVAAAVARGSEDGIYQHVNGFVAAGGSREALIAGLNAVIMACGGFAWACAGLALEVYDELSAAK